ncbi:hypothetical protein [Marinivivus vitaminiproducens]|uniref:hypothetical protein n=1 Tax=Marinivivus vitaminiproducens TaxID=3035935 RepID=UPI0027A318D9|nr:DUF429 domain-containing protein [Geminicoccaceae bacterium SCSIO 64248]
MRPPSVLAHADWSVSPAKRWLAAARRGGDGWQILDVRRAGTPGDLLDRLRAEARGPGPVLLGVDFPIGLPRVHARLAGITDFPKFLDRLDSDPAWADFGRPAETPDQIALRRPFYPMRSGGALRRHLVEGLGVPDYASLQRRCERRQHARPAASVLFWTMGGQQVGKAALSGWREIVLPARRSTPPLALWPFDGRLADLLDTRDAVIAEAYPAEFYRQLGLPLAQGGSKRRQTDRACSGVALLAHAAGLGVAVPDGLRTRMRDGFGPSPSGEDAFDAIAGLFGVLALLVRGRAPDPPHDDPDLWRVEGWIFGQSA